MIYNDFLGNKVSRLGFGAMRLPLNADNTINEAEVEKMVDYCMANGVNYFDTAWPYHSGLSESVLCRYLNKYPRESYYLADKYPGHMIASSYNPADIFEKQLEKCGVEYFDYYLLHNVCESSVDVYEDQKWGIVDYFIEQHRLGRIRHLGFSTHGRPDNMRYILEKFGEHLEFCQIQCNYLDWTLQEANEKYRLLSEKNIPIIIMEPLRGGKLCSPDDAVFAPLRALKPEDSPVKWAFRFLQDLPMAKVTLSGMSNSEQLKENIGIYGVHEPLSETELKALLNAAECMKDAIPCTGCRYCTDSCPMELDIPMLIAAYNDLKFTNGGFTVGMQMDALPENKLASACIGCGSCSAICPQNIDIPNVMNEFADLLSRQKSWAEICKEREAAAKKSAGE